MASILGHPSQVWDWLPRPVLATLAALALQFGPLGCVHLPSFAEALAQEEGGREDEGPGQSHSQSIPQSEQAPPPLPMEPQERPPAKGKRWEWSGDDRQITHIWIDTDTQKARFYDGTDQVGWSYVASGIKSYPTPTGRFAVIGKEKTKESNLYGKIYNADGKVVVSDAKRGRHKIPPGGRFAGAKMPYFLRLTNDGVGLHAGPIPRPGHPASHGCIRLPASLAQRLFTQVPRGTPVTITGSGPDYGDYQAKLAAQGPSRQEPAEGGFANSSDAVKTYPAKLTMSQPQAQAQAVKPKPQPGRNEAQPSQAKSDATGSPSISPPPSVIPPPARPPTAQGATSARASTYPATAPQTAEPPRPSMETRSLSDQDKPNPSGQSPSVSPLPAPLPRQPAGTSETALRSPLPALAITEEVKSNSATGTATASHPIQRPPSGGSLVREASLDVPVPLGNPSKPLTPESSSLSPPVSVLGREEGTSGDQEAVAPKETPLAPVEQALPHSDTRLPPANGTSPSSSARAGTDTPVGEPSVQALSPQSPATDK
jgi:lipoprotein-anchoring transpeptidase ErfK/SrfK